MILDRSRSGPGPPWIGGLALFFGAYLVGPTVLPSPLLEAVILGALWLWWGRHYTHLGVWGPGLASRRPGPALALFGLSWAYSPPLGAAMTCFWEEVAPGFAELLEAPWSGGEILASFTVGPLLEEVVFRGFLLCAWTHRLGLRRAVLLSSALFGLLHPQEPLGAFAAGVVLCALRVRYGTLWVPVTFHSLFNLSAVLLGSGLDASPWAAYLETFVRSNLPMLATVGGLGVAATLLYSLRLMAGRALFEGGAPARRPG